MPQSVSNGKRIFNQSCSACHDAVGTGSKSGPSLKGYYRRQPHLADGAVHAFIQKGKGRMPAFSALSGAQVNDLIAYLKTL
jgi:mono/diheme cytochrome c family protein